MKKQKKYKAKLYPLYSIQFYLDRQKTLCIQETSNIKNGTEPFVAEGFNMQVFAEHIGKSELLTRGDKIAMAVFYESLSKQLLKSIK